MAPGVPGEKARAADVTADDQTTGLEAAELALDHGSGNPECLCDLMTVCLPIVLEIEQYLAGGLATEHGIYAGADVVVHRSLQVVATRSKSDRFYMTSIRFHMNSLGSIGGRQEDVGPSGAISLGSLPDT